jgi:2-methylcitrate dehydratase PrpD
LFAEAGITGPHSILEGEKGFCKVFAGDYDLNRLTEGLGTHYHMLDNALKLYSCCHHIHAAFDALDKARDTEPLQPGQVKSIKVFTNSEPILSNIGSIVEPEDVLGAQFSLPFSFAMRLHHGGRGVNGGNGFWDYLKVNLKDPKLLDTARKVTCVVANNNEWTRVDKGAGIEIETTDGRHIKEIVLFPKGFPENPLSADDVKEKFHSLVDRVLPGGRSREIVDAVDNIERIVNIDELGRLLVVPPAKRLTAVAGGER